MTRITTVAALRRAGRIPILAAVAILGAAACGGDDDGAAAPLECPEQADGMCAPDAPDGCWTWSALRAEAGADCYEARFSTCTSGGVDAGGAITCWNVTYPDGGTAHYVTFDTSHRFPTDWSVSGYGDGCSDPTDACDP